MTVFVLVTTLLVTADQLTKIWAANSFTLGDIGRYVGFGFYLTYVQNTGAAFGILQNGTLILGIVSAVVSLLLLTFMLTRQRDMSRLQRAAFTLILAGALGNMIDRFRLGYVIDFIHFKLPRFDFPVFNLADSFVVVGAALLLGSSLFNRSRPDKPENDADVSSFQLPY